MRLWPLFQVASIHARLWLSWLTLLLLILLLLGGCVSVPTVADRTANADKLAAAADWHRETLKLGDMALVAYLPSRKLPSATLTVYIEGDGLAWIGSRRPSLNPTPISPLALQLALAQPEGNAAYLARPCQYLENDPLACEPRYWTDARFSEEVIAASNAAIDSLKHRFNATQLQLVGYSGGAAVAVLLAARRNDVTSLVTVAGNLDHRMWSEQHLLSPLTASLNPADARQELNSIEQLHLVGGRDATISPMISQQFIAGLPQPNVAQRKVMLDFDHQCCWVRNWPDLWLAWKRDKAM